jgi:hypothetical protein
MGVRRSGRMSRNATVAVGCVGLLSALVTLCGCSELGAAADSGLGGGSSAEARELLRDVADVLVASGSSQARTAMQMVSGGTRITIYAEGGFDYVRRMGELRVTLPMEESEPVTELFVPGALYMKNRGAGVPADKWVRINTADLPDGNLVTGGATDPITAAELLRGVQQATDLGLTEIDGEKLWHYRGITDIAAAAAAAAQPSRDQLTAAVGGFADTAVAFDAYLDRDGLLRKVRHHFSFANGDSGPPEGIDVVSTTALYDFGSPVRIVMPARDDIYSGTVGTNAGM